MTEKRGKDRTHAHPPTHYMHALARTRTHESNTHTHIYVHIDVFIYQNKLIFCLMHKKYTRWHWVRKEKYRSTT